MLDIVNLSKSYGLKPSLQGVSFHLAPGECLGIAGHNGSGKSTLLSLIAQVLKPDAGDILHKGKSILGDRQFMRRQVGFVPQDNRLLDDVTVEETLAFWQNIYGLPKDDLFAPGGIDALLGLADIRRQKVTALSGGMAKRLSIALALLHQPACLLLDEALPALDRSYRLALQDYLAAYKGRGHSILYCSHEGEELSRFCDRIIILQNGRIVFNDSAGAFPQDAGQLDALLNPTPEAKNKGGSLDYVYANA